MDRFNIPGFTTERTDGHFQRTPHGGVALLVHNSIPYQRINIDSPIQAVAVRFKLSSLITVCNIYNSRSHALNKDLLTNLFQQLPQPVLLLGDFNAYNTMWGSITTDRRGLDVENFANDSNLNILNNGSPTRILYQTESCIDLSLCSASIEPELEWSIMDSPLNSDHCPIFISCNNNARQENATIWCMEKAQWDKYTESKAWDDLPNIESNDQSYLLENLYQRIMTAREEAIPKLYTSKYYPKPWWNEALKQSRDRREELYQRYRHRRNNVNLIAWRRSRATHKTLVKKSKRDSWIQFVETLNSDTPLPIIYENLRKITGKQIRNISMLKINDTTYSTIPEISEKLAQTFSQTSSNENYDETFLDYKRLCEQTPVNFDSDNSEIYNRPFSLTEMNFQLNKTKNTAPGKDETNYLMIKNLPENTKAHLLNIYNKFWNSGFFPEIWRSAIVVPIPKPGKDRSLPSNYRPIALTSCICKLLERMINHRLLEYLDMTRSLSNEQCGCRRNRSTQDHLVRLENSIKTAFVKNEHFISIFFDIEKAYDMTWCYGILKDLHDTGLKGNLPKYIASFLKNRKLQVRLKNHLSNEYPQENGVPQGSVLSVTLFAVKINSIVTCIPKTDRWITSLYVDDLQVGMRHPDLSTIQADMQQCLNRLNEWTKTNGLKFSSSKTKVVHFHRNPAYQNKPVLQILGNPIPYVEEFKFLGLWWDSKLNWKCHIAKLKGSCSKLLGLLRMITCQKWGSDQSTTMKVFRMYIRSKLDYGCSIYSSTSPSNLKPLQIICNESLRISTGAFKSTPIETLHVLAGEMPLEYRRDYLALRYLYKIKSFTDNPAYNSLIPQHNRRLFENNPVIPPLSIRSRQMIEKYDLRISFVKNNFSYLLLNISKPTWSLTDPDVCFELNQFPKQTTPPQQYLQLFLHLCQTTYHDHISLFTDGSKKSNGVGSAVVHGNRTESSTLPKESSILSAEIQALKMAINCIKRLSGSQFVIFSDSCSALKMLRNNYGSHPIIRSILHDIDYLNLRSGKHVKLCWIPSHIGITMNEKADAAANAAADGTEQFIHVYFKDWYPAISRAITDSWKQTWLDSRQKMVEIKDNLDYFPIITSLPRRHEVIINRLRSGHCRFSHGHLMEGNAGPPICTLCRDALMTVKHVLIDCTAVQAQRTALKNSLQVNIINLKILLGTFINAPAVINFIQNIELLDAV